MNSINNNSESVNPNQTLSEEDIQFCDSVFETYRRHFYFIGRLYKKIDDQIVSHRDTSAELFSSELDSLDKTVNDFCFILSNLTTTLIGYIETHLKQQYNIEFKSFEIEDKESGVELHSYRHLIDNITSQIGPDLTLAGKSKISNEFIALFRWPEYQPILKGDKISFPSLASYDYSNSSEKYSLTYQNENMKKLLAAICLYFLDRTKVPDTFKTQIIEWQREVSFSTCYLLLGELNVSVRFYKNRRVDLICKDAKTASDFWTRFNLENIVALYREANPK